MPEYERLDGSPSGSGCCASWGVFTSLEKKLIVFTTLLGAIIFALTITLMFHPYCQEPINPTTVSPTTITTSPIYSTTSNSSITTNPPMPTNSTQPPPTNSTQPPPTNSTQPPTAGTTEISNGTTPALKTTNGTPKTSPVTVDSLIPHPILMSTKNKTVV